MEDKSFKSKYVRLEIYGQTMVTLHFSSNAFNFSSLFGGKESTLSFELIFGPNIIRCQPQPQYLNDVCLFLADSVQPSMVIKQLKMEGFLLSSFTHKHRFPSALKQLAQWLVEVKNQESLLL